MQKYSGAVLCCLVLSVNLDCIHKSHKKVTAPAKDKLLLSSYSNSPMILPFFIICFSAFFRKLLFMELALMFISQSKE